MRKDYPGFQLSITDLSVPQDEVVGLIGHNGSGKSTFLKIVAGILRPDALSLELDGDVLGDTLRLRERIGLCPDHPAVYDWMTGVEFARFIVQTGLCDDRRLHEALQLLRVPLTKSIGKLSFGNRAKLNVAMAIGRGTAVTLFDEPISGLDMQTRQEVIEFLRYDTSKDHPRYTVMSTHSVEDLLDLAGEVIIFRQGRCVLQCSMLEVRQDYFIRPSDAVKPASRPAPSRIVPQVVHRSNLPAGSDSRLATPREVFLAFGAEAG